MVRAFFVVLSVTVLALAGCADDGDRPASSGDAAGTGGTGGSPPAPYANVTAVAATGDSGAYTFAVTVESADVDCTQYADWWEVVSESGALVYRRIIEHSHTDENGTTDPDAPGNTFTRDGGPVEISADDVVIVRAHMNDGGYQGMARRGSVTDGFAEAPDIGPDFAADLENDTPLPSSCLF